MLFIRRFSVRQCILSVFIGIGAFLLTSCLSSAQAETLQNQLKFDHFSVDDGLTQSSVIDIAQDKHGYLWIATFDGLNRFDGQHFTHFNEQKGVSTSLPGNFIRALLYDSSDRLWVGTERGIALYRPSQNNFARLSLNGDLGKRIWDIFELPGAQIWASTEQGLAHLNDDSSQFEQVTFYTEKGDPLPLNEIKSSALYNNHLWLGSYDHGLFRVDLKSGTGRQIPLHDINGDAIDDIHQIVEHNQQLWLATNHGIRVINAMGEQISPALPLPHSLMNMEIRRIEFSDDGEIWIGTTTGFYFGDEQTPIHRVEDEDNSARYNTIGYSYILSLFRDRAGNLWIGSQGGLSRHRSITRQFLHYQIASSKSAKRSSSVSSIAEDAVGNIWLGTELGDLLEWQPTTMREIRRAQDLPGIRKLTFDEKHNKLWIADAEGLSDYDITTHQRHRYTMPQGVEPLMDIVLDNEGTLWIASQNRGLLSYQPETKVWQRHSLPKRFPAAAAHLNVLMLRGNDLWLGSAEGAYLYNLSTQQFENNNPLSPKQGDSMAPAIWSMQKDVAGIWFGSFDDGLYYLNDNGFLQHFDRANNHLSNNYIYSIELEQPGIVWVSTNLGLNKVNRGKGTVRQYSERDGLQSNEFNHHSSLNSKSGYMYFGGINGFNRFLPNKIHDENFSGEVVVEGLKISNKPITPSANEARLQADISTLSPVNLFYHDSPFSLDFTVPNAPRPELVRYQYRLKDFDHQWLTTDSRVQQATYTNIPVGYYQFEVKAYDINGDWQTGVTRLPIGIMAPPWRTPAAYGIYILGGGSLLCLVFLYMRQVARQRQRLTASEERLKLSLWGSGDELWDWDIKTGKIYRSNIWKRLNFPQDGQRSSLPGDEGNIHPRDLPRVQEALKAHFDGVTEHFQATYRVRDKENKWLWILDRGKIVARDEHNKPQRMTGTIKDINQLKQAEEQLKLFARSFENISDGVFILDHAMTLVEINHSYTRISGESREEALGKRLTFNQYPPNFTQQIYKALENFGRWFGELEAVRPDGSHYDMELAIDAIRDDTGEISHFVGVFSDISGRKQTEDELRKLANSDTLTGLANRSLFQANHSNLVNRNIPHALLVCDLDNFKKINDSMSHKVGDQLLCLLASRLLRCGRPEDTLYRLGGDEFAVVVEGISEMNTVTQVAKRMQSAMQEPFELQGRELVVTASIGIVMFPFDGSDSQELLRNADTAMYHAKGQGHNRYVFFSESMNQTAVRQLQLESLVRQAIREDLFVLEYQPKFDLTDRSPAGMEALVRLDHPEHGRISPVDFIPLAEETGLIVEIGDIVLKKACFAAEAWRRRGLFNGRVAVNVSAKQFTEGDLPSRVRQILTLTELPPSSLELEITEGAVMAAPTKAISAMSALRELGVHIALDDFGTGYSSLAYLKRFPIDTLKIDRTFVQDIATSAIDRKMVASIIAIAHNLELEVVAEGVEQENQLMLLKEMQCQYIQGFLLSKPLSESNFNDFLLTHIERKTNR